MSGRTLSKSHEHDWRDLAAPNLNFRHVPIHSSSASVDRPFLTSNNLTASSSLSPSKRSRSLSPSGMTDDYIDYPQHSSSSSMDDAPQRTLRRTKRMILRSSQSTLQRSETDLATISTTSHSTPEPHSHPLVPLGHPSRPYYSAIRKNMSRPSSPFDTTHHSTPLTSHHTLTKSPLLHSISLALPDDSDYENYDNDNDDMPYSAFAFATATPLTTSRIFTPPVSGFSLSGETEMRMALARQRVRQHAGASSGGFSEYEFREGGVRNRKQWVRGQMKRLGRAFKHLVVGLSVKVTA
jgi:hypothetical protein